MFLVYLPSTFLFDLQQSTTTRLIPLGACRLCLDEPSTLRCVDTTTMLYGSATKKSRTQQAPHPEGPEGGCGAESYCLSKTSWIAIRPPKGTLYVVFMQYELTRIEIGNIIYMYTTVYIVYNICIYTSIRVLSAWPSPLAWPFFTHLLPFTDALQCKCTIQTVGQWRS